jgi:hypothetical protein
VLRNRWDARNRKFHDCLLEEQDLKSQFRLRRSESHVKRVI